MMDARADFRLSVTDLGDWERDHGRLRAGSLVTFRTGRAGFFGSDPDRYAAPAPGFAAEAVEWLFTERRVRAIGSDTFGPDATSDEEFGATRAALEHGGVVLANLGPGLDEMRPYGDWVSVNSPRPAFSGFPVGVTGFTVLR